jgi:UDP-N-acetylglucosamine diphosphorylase / glucose-1-phosphate thymidylyltransferase / UDP-N-acetylgalactosamine diphosphorylase / glucosamine-1-phosphate N-acetyltransferase / galactosamine-1-phosphate N-acetyltransferase
MVSPTIRMGDYVSALFGSPIRPYAELEPWLLTQQAESIVRRLLNDLLSEDFDIRDEIAVHRTARIEKGAVLKGPLILGAETFVASSAYLRGGNWVSERCTFGPGAELKSSFVFPGTKLAHFNFVGDSVLGTDVNLEAGSVICNYRNERSHSGIRIRRADRLDSIPVDKFGALVGDHSRIGANAVIAPGALLAARSVVGRSTLLDQEA